MISCHTTFLQSPWHSLCPETELDTNLGMNRNKKILNKIYQPNRWPSHILRLLRWWCLNLRITHPSHLDSLLLSTPPYRVCEICSGMFEDCESMSKIVQTYMTRCLDLSSQDSTRPRMMQAEVIYACTMSKVPYLARWKCWFMTECTARIAMSKCDLLASLWCFYKTSDISRCVLLWRSKPEVASSTSREGSTQALATASCSTLDQKM